MEHVLTFLLIRFAVIAAVIVIGIIGAALVIRALRRTGRSDQVRALAERELLPRLKDRVERRIAGASQTGRRNVRR